VYTNTTLQGGTEMKFDEINKRYSRQVARYISKGYWINAGTMGGSQGEIAHVDMTNGTELIRILIEDRTDYELNNGYGMEYVTVLVGRVPASENVKIGSTDRLGNTVWNNNLEVISEQRFYKIGKSYRGWYVDTFEEAIAAKELKRERLHARVQNAPEKRVFKNAENAVKSFVKRQPGCKTVALREIEEVGKDVTVDRSGKNFVVRYYVKARGHQFYMQ
jgi:hypothetical protein